MCWIFVAIFTVFALLETVANDKLEFVPFKATVVLLILDLIAQSII